MRRLLAVVAILCFASGPAAGAADSPARAVVDSLHETLLAVMKDAATLGFAGRRDTLAPVIAASFDMALIARITTGRNWKRFDGGRQQRLIDALGRLNVATYADRFDDYSGESFRVVSERPAARGTVLVNGELVKSDGETIRIDYLLRPTGDGWRIIDVYLKGIYSELALRRSEYAAVLKRDGADGLLAAIEKKIAEYESDAAAQ